MRYEPRRQGKWQSVLLIHVGTHLAVDTTVIGDQDNGYLATVAEGNRVELVNRDYVAKTASFLLDNGVIVGPVSTADQMLVAVDPELEIVLPEAIAGTED